MAEAKVQEEIIYAFTRQPGEEDKKLAPQAKVILDTLEAAGGPLTKSQLLESLQGKIQTVQPVERILAFYQKCLIEGNYMSMQKPVAPPKAEKKAKGKGKKAEAAEAPAEAAAE